MQDPSRPDVQIDVAAARAAKISFVSLGCPKALVDSERIVTRLKAEGYELTRAHHGADLVIVNTCGFLDTAKAELLQAIGDALAENGKVIVTGCLGAEPESITERLPNVLAVSGPQQYEKVMAAVHRAAPRPHAPFLDLVPPQGVKLTPRHYAYLKISEGCNNRCTFCIIPRLRGDLVSRRAGRRAARGGETGRCRGERTARHLAGHFGLWRRPQIRSERLGRPRRARAFHRSVARARRLRRVGAAALCLPLPACRRGDSADGGGQVLPYLDVPFQHAAPDVLKAMRRPAAQEKTLERIRRWREDLSRADHPLDLHRRLPRRDRGGLRLPARLARRSFPRPGGMLPLRAGRGAVANELGATGAGRGERGALASFHAATAGDLGEAPEGKVGTRQQVIIDEPGPSLAKGRSKADAPEIDGAVYVAARRPLRAGEIATVKIERADAYDLYGTAVGFS